MHRLILALLVFTFCLYGLAFSQTEESLTITTYYPSPFGVYDELTVNDLYINNRVGIGYTVPQARLCIDGNVGIGTDNPTAGFRLDVLGRIRCESLQQYSSKDYKKDIKALVASDYHDILHKLEQTQIFRFRFKDEGEDSKLKIGLIAEESPKEILGHDDKGIDMGTTIGFLMAAVKAQQEEINILKQEINRLKNR